MNPTENSTPEPTNPTAAESAGAQLDETPSPAVVTPTIVSPTATPATTAIPAPSTPAFQPPTASASDTPTVVSPPPAAATVSPRSKRSKKQLAIIIVIVALVLLGGYAFAFYIPNTPSHVYSASLSNSGKAVDKLTSYFQAQDSATYKGASFDSSMKLKSSTVSFDATLSGAFDKDANANVQFKADIEGQNVTANIRSVKAAGNTSPDVYLQVTGVKSYLDSAGLNTLDSLDGQWISIDHTLIDTYARSIKSSLDSTTNSSVANAAATPTPVELNDAIAKVQVVNKQYLFTTDSSKAVLANEKFIAKETKNGRSVDHYKVGYNKAHLQAYVTALGSALDSSKLNAWSKQANAGKSLSEVLGLKGIQTSITNDKNTAYTFDLWADTKTKLVSAVQFTDTTDSSAKFTLSQNYTGGAEYPFGLETTDKTSNAKLDLTINAVTNKVTGDFDFSSTGSDSTSLTGTFNVTPSNDSVKVTAPAGAKSINDVLNQLGLNSLLTAPSTTTDSTSLGSNTFTLTQ